MEILVFIFGILMVVFFVNWIVEMKAHDRTKWFKKQAQIQNQRVMVSWKETIDMKKHYKHGLVIVKHSITHEEAVKKAKEYLDSKPLPF